MGVKCICFFLNVLGSTRYFLTCYSNYWNFWCPSYNDGLHYDLFSCETTQEGQFGVVANFASLINSAVGIFYVYFVFLICCSPYFISFLAFEINGPNTTLKKFFLFSLTLLYLNSSLNPVIYCWKMRHIRHALMNILRNMSRYRSRVTHETLALSGHTLSAP